MSVVYQKVPSLGSCRNIHVFSYWIGFIYFGENMYYFGEWVSAANPDHAYPMLV